MSLTGHFKDKNSPIRTFLRDQFPDTRTFLKDPRSRLREGDMIRPDGDIPFGTIGTAFDYRLRYYFGVTPYSELVAFRGAAHLGLSHDFFDELETLLNHCNPIGRRLAEAEEDELNRHCVVLALLEEVARAGLRPGSPLAVGESHSSKALIGIAKPHWLDDLRALSWKFYDGFNNLLTQPNVLNPTFEGSAHVGGADADLIVDGRLIDIKTSAKQEIQSDSIWQLLGYVLLDYSDVHRINSISLYMARQGIFFQWDLDEAIRGLRSGNKVSVDELRGQLKAIAHRG